MQREQGEVTAVPGMVGGMCATWGLVGVLRGAIMGGGVKRGHYSGGGGGG